MMTKKIINKGKKNKFINLIIKFNSIPILAIIGIIITIYVVINPDIRMALEPPSFVHLVNPVLLEDGRVISDVSVKQKFVNKSVKPGYIKTIKITTQGLDPKDYSTSITFHDQFWLYIFFSKNITFTSKIEFKNYATFRKSENFITNFFDNNDNPIFIDGLSDSLAYIDLKIIKAK